MSGLCQRCSEGCVAEEPVLRPFSGSCGLSWVVCCVIVCWLCWTVCAVLSDQSFQGAGLNQNNPTM